MKPAIILDKEGDLFFECITLNDEGRFYRVRRRNRILSMWAHAGDGHNDFLKEMNEYRQN
jgi:hypothetical protein